MIRVGLLGASRISKSAILAPVAQVDDVEVVSVAARDPRRAAAFASEHRIPEAAADYAALVTSADVDLVYVGLPPSEHARWSMAALAAAKHVLCEKPFALHAEEAIAMVAAARDSGKTLIEAFHYRFHPLFERVLDIVHGNEIGAVRGLRARFNVPVADRANELRYVAALGGGAMMDLGCYPVHWVRSVMRVEPVVVAADATWHASGVDVAMQAELEFPNRVPAQIATSMSVNLPAGIDAELEVIGDNGRVVANNPLAPHRHHSLVVESGDKVVSEEVPGQSTYYHQLRHVVAVLEGKEEPITGGDDAVGNMRILDEVYRQAGR